MKNRNKSNDPAFQKLQKEKQGVVAVCDVDVDVDVVV